MFGIDALFNGPAIIKAAATAKGIQAARLDYDPAAGVLWASLRVHGKVTSVEIPTGKVFTLDDMMAVLFPESVKAPANPAGPRAIAQPAAGIPTAATSPP
jgi:hypothetical protein